MHALAAAEALSLACRSCGGPLTGGLTAPCPACGSAPSADPALHRRLERAAGRIRRVRSRVHAHARNGVASVTAKRFQAPLAIGFLTAFLGPTFFLLFPALVVLERAMLPGWAAPLLAVGALLAAGSGPVLAVGLIFGLGSWIGRRGEREADAIVSGVTLAVPARCPGCGAHLQRLVVGVTGADACPWCEAALAAPDKASTALDAAEQAIVTAFAARGRDAWIALLGAARQARRPSAAGLDWDAGVWTGEVGGIPLWCAESRAPGGVLRQLEVDVPTVADAPCWLLPRAAAPFARTAEALGWPSPAPGDPRWRGPADAVARLEAVPEVQALARALTPREALLVEPAGLSLWRLSPNGLAHLAWLPTSWLRVRAPQVVAAAAALKPSTPPSPPPGSSPSR